MKTRDGGSIMLAVVLAALAGLMYGGCKVGPASPSAIGETAPRFADMVNDRTYLLNSITCILQLPEATGGDGRLRYSLTLAPAAPDWSFNSTERTLTVPTTMAGVWEATYRVADTDEDNSDADADQVTFSITVTEPDDRPLTEDGISSRYHGCGNQVFFLNPEGQTLSDTLYTLVLDAASADVYVIATNTTADHVTPNVELIETAAASTDLRLLSVGRPNLSRRWASEAFEHGRQSLTRINNTPPSVLLAGVSSPLTSQTDTSGPPPVNTGDRFTFRDADFDTGTVTEIPATARTVVSDGATTLAIWVADVDWGTCELCVRQEMVDALAVGFLRPGANNDIYDWVTAIFGDPWGPHDSQYLIPAEYAAQIHILIFDIDGDGLDAEGISRSGFFFAKDNYLRSHGTTDSNERLMFYADAPFLANRWQPKRFLSLLTHEFQHMINYYQKVVTHDAFSEAWINEMASMVAEDLVADKVMVTGPRGAEYDDPTAGRP